MSCILHLHNIRAYATLGVYAWEQEQRRPIVLDLDLEFDAADAIGFDDLSHGINYHHVTVSLNDFLSQYRSALLEKLAHDTAHWLFETYPLIEKIKLTVTKLNAIKQVDVSLTIKTQRFSSKAL